MKKNKKYNAKRRKIKRRNKKKIRERRIWGDLGGLFSAVGKTVKKTYSP